MRHIAELKEMLCRELDEIAEKGVLSSGDLETVDKLAHSIKNLDKIRMMEGEYSNSGGDWTARGTYGGGGRMHYDTSYRGRRRDSMGRYSRADAMEDMADKLRDMLDNTSDAKIREALESALRKMEG